MQSDWKPYQTAYLLVFIYLFTYSCFIMCFCCSAKWITGVCVCVCVYVCVCVSHMFMLCISICPFPPKPPSLRHPTPLGHHRALSWAPCALPQLPTSCLVDSLWCVYINATLSVDPTLSFPFSCVHKSIFYICVSTSSPADRSLSTILLHSRWTACWWRLISLSSGPLDATAHHVAFCFSRVRRWERRQVEQHRQYITW